MFKKISAVLFTVLVALFSNVAARAATEPSLQAETAILIDAPTGKMLYGKDEHKRIFPASMTKILTALVALDYLEKDEIIVAGNEVNMVPGGSSLAGLLSGEAVTAENAIRALMIPSGNEAACVLAIEVARRETDNQDLSYINAERVFADLMNKKAEELGAENSNFVNPHGFHDPNHFSSAYDLALISRVAMENELIRKTVAETSFADSGAGSAVLPEGAKNQEYSWYTHNELLISSGEYYYPYATGIKTGFTDEAGDSVAASAEKDGKSLIAIVCFSEDPGRWTDAQDLFDYGFDNFDIEVVQQKDVVLDSVPLFNFTLGAEDTLEVVTKSEFSDIFSEDQLDAITREIKYKPELLATVEEGGTGTEIKAPVTQGTVVATVIYSLDGEVIFEDELLANRDVEERTLKSDFDYYLNRFRELAFSLIAIPFWIAGAVVIFVIFRLLSYFRHRRQNRYRRLRRR